MGERIIFLTVSSKFLAPLPGTPVYKIGELHTIFYLFFLVLFVYLPVFTFVSLIKNTKIHVTLLVVTTMAGSFAFGEAEVLTFNQRGGESLKDAWYRINDSQKRATRKQSTTILLRNLYVGLLLGIGLF